MKIGVNNNTAAPAYLGRSKLDLNSVFTKQVFIDQLNKADFDKVRNTPEFNKLAEFE